MSAEPGRDPEGKREGECDDADGDPGDDVSLPRPAHVRVVRTMGQQANASVHVKGETYGELGVAYLKMGDTANARKTFKKLSELLPGTPFAERAKKELIALDAK